MKFCQEYEYRNISNLGQAFVDAIQVVRNEEMDLFFKLKFIMVMFVFVPIQWMLVLMPLMALVAASMIV